VSVRFLSVCSGLEGASLAFEGLGWAAAGFSEIEPFPAALLSERYGSNALIEKPSRNAPPNFGDFTKIDLDGLGQVDLLVGGTPCQAFSIAGKRLSLADARGNLTLAYVVLAHELARSHGLRNCLWENVPGVLNTPDNAFGCFLGALVGHDRALPCPEGEDGPTRVWLTDHGRGPRGGFSTLNISAWPNDASVCSLSRILETGPIPPKYYLSPKACAGILRRAEKRGKELPPLLKQALVAVADSPTITTPQDCSSPSGGATAADP
jgi:hypothetical protein